MSPFRNGLDQHANDELQGLLVYALQFSSIDMLQRTVFYSYAGKSFHSTLTLDGTATKTTLVARIATTTIPIIVTTISAFVLCAFVPSSNGPLFMVVK